MSILAIFVGAAILGISIAVMEEDEFPGWGSMIVCVLAAIVAAAIINDALAPEHAILGHAAGAGCAIVAIPATGGMTLHRAAIAAGIYFAVQLALSYGLQAMMQPA